MLAVIAALAAVMGTGLAHPVAPYAQVRACEAAVVRYVDAGGNLAAHTDAAVRHDCGGRAGLDRREVHRAERFAYRTVTLHNS
jgi:hypothetical protein